MHPERVDIARVSAIVVVAVVVVVAIIVAAVRAFGSLPVGHLFPIF
jgi:hypothetical protein